MDIIPCTYSTSLTFFVHHLTPFVPHWLFPSPIPSHAVCVYGRLSWLAIVMAWLVLPDNPFIDYPKRIPQGHLVTQKAIQKKKTLNKDFKILLG